jgi:hypothetical protein
MLSYSPRQIVSGFAQRTLMPLIFCELALAYPPAKVSDPNQRIAAANGQFLLVEREAYRRLGGHKAVADRVLEDVELANLAKRRKIGLRFPLCRGCRCCADVSNNLCNDEGWTKNLALLFNNALFLAAWRILDIALSGWVAVVGHRAMERTICGSFAGMVGRWLDTVAAVGAKPDPLLCAGRQIEFPIHGLRPIPVRLATLFAALLYRSWFQHKVLKRVSWKGRTYAG